MRNEFVGGVGAGGIPPILSDGMPCISDMSEVVGDMNGVSPISEAALQADVRSITEARMRVERGVRTE